MLNDYHEKKLFDLIKNGSFNDSNCFEWNGPKDKNGYGVTTFTVNKIKKTWKVHRLIYFLLRQELPEDMLVCHACDNPSCFNICHLFLGTPKDNSQDRERKGRSRNQLGEANSSATLTQVLVLQIRKLYDQGVRIRDIVKEFNLPQSTVSKIVHRKRWKHI